MTWNYRIIRHPDPDGFFALHEVHYHDDGRVRSWTEEPISFVCGLDEGLEGIIGSLEIALRDAKTRPVLELGELERGADT